MTHYIYIIKTETEFLVLKGVGKTLFFIGLIFSLLIIASASRTEAQNG